MSQTESQTTRGSQSSQFRVSPQNLIPREFAEIGRKRLEALTEIQTVLFETLLESNQNWFSRVQSEAILASEFGTNLTAANSITEAATVCREWVSRRVDMANKDASRLLTNNQKFVTTGSRLLTNDWLFNGWNGDST